MFNKIKLLQEITRTDEFLDLPTESQLLYYAFVVDAGNKGDIYNPKAITRMHGFDESTLKALYDEGYIELSENDEYITIIVGYEVYTEVE